MLFQTQLQLTCVVLGSSEDKMVIDYIPFQQMCYTFSSVRDIDDNMDHLQ